MDENDRHTTAVDGEDSGGGGGTAMVSAMISAMVVALVATIVTSTWSSFRQTGGLYPTELMLVCGVAFTFFSFLAHLLNRCICLFHGKQFSGSGYGGGGGGGTAKVLVTVVCTRSHFAPKGLTLAAVVASP